MTSEPEARELSILLLVVLKMVLVADMEIIMLFILMKFPKFWSDFGAGDDFLGVAWVEYIDKVLLLFGLDYSTIR